MSSLLHPEYFDGIPFVGSKIKSQFELLEEDVKPTQEEQKGITVGIRTLNEAAKLETLLEDIQSQEFGGDIEIVVVDNESSDNTIEVATKFGAKILSLPRSEFTYPRSMNMAMEAASHELVYLTVGHAALVSSRSFRAGVTSINDSAYNAAGAFGHALPGPTASTIENSIAMGNLFYARRRTVKKAGIGTMAATGSLLRKSAWSELGTFDERFERGGEDTRLAQEMIDSGYAVVDEPLLGTHHTHGLDLTDTVKQWVEWSRLGKPLKIDTPMIQKRRPDLHLEI